MPERVKEREREILTMRVKEREGDIDKKGEGEILTCVKKKEGEVRESKGERRRY